MSETTPGICSVLILIYKEKTIIFYLRPIINILAMLRPFGCIVPKTLIIWFSNPSVLSLPDEDYSKNVSYTLNLISIFL